MQTHRRLFLTLFGLVLFVFLGFGIFIAIKTGSSIIPPSKPNVTKKLEVTATFGQMEQFKSDEEFIAFMQKSESQMGGGFAGSLMMNSASMEKSSNVRDQAFSAQSSVSGDSQRVSQTNTQVIGIDEPDIVKTDGETIFYSQPIQNYLPTPIEPMLPDQPILFNNPQESRTSAVDMTDLPISSKKIALPPPGVDAPPFDLMPPPLPKIKGGIAAIKAKPVSALRNVGNISVSGDLLLNKDVLVVFNEDNWTKRSIDGYDVSRPNKPEKKWSLPYKTNASKIQARLYKNKLYLITRLEMGSTTPCPFRPFDVKGEMGVIPCRTIYHPDVPVGADSVYTASIINPQDGTIEKNVSFVGSLNENTIYMSEDSLYIAYGYQGDMTKLMYSFVLENSSMYPAAVVERLGKLVTYDISQQAKLMELTQILMKMTLGMDNDKRLVYESNQQNRMKIFMKKHARDLDKTGIVKINLDNFNITATGEVPGKVLNQFSLDEYKGNLRIATTVGQNSWFGNFGQLTESFSDVYVLNDNLDNIGSVIDLGKSERIYSARFIANRGYIVTFRQTDPFYVLDLSNPGKPQLKGELKIPGYSSYLHPLGDVILGVGKEGDKVKLSLFDVTDASDPQEIDKYTMNEYWSEALNNHHAFLADEKHKVFFIPGNQGGYVFSYQDNKLNLVAGVADFQVQRAIYINDYLYVLGQNRIVVFDENKWEKVGELSL